MLKALLPVSKKKIVLREILKPFLRNWWFHDQYLDKNGKNDGFSETWRKIAVSRVLGVENLKPMVVSLKLGVLAMLKAEGLSHRQNPPVSMNTTIGFQVFIPPGTREYRKISPKFH